MQDDKLDLPGVKQKFIGLLSGGKDSCFNLMHCLANGHELVAIATLQPATGVDELDSHMYQSVGTQLLPYIARAIPNAQGTGSIPLYTHEIKGQAVELGPEYGDRTKGGEGSETKGDETEDLTALLKKVMAAHPEATAISSGAILSNYQRLRIEHVCGRLKLVSLAYLWQSNQTALLESMFRAGLEAVLVKVAGVGLGVESVGKDLASMMPQFRRLERQYGSHPAGEGGEYETITLDTPIFSHRLNLTKKRTIITQPEPYPVAYLKVEEVELEEKPGWVRPSVVQLRELLGLDSRGIMEESSQELLEEIGDVSYGQPGDAEEGQGDVSSKGGSGVQFARNGRWFAASIDGTSAGKQDAGEELKECFEIISKRLSQEGLSLPLHSTHVTLLISSMDLFAPANAVYTTFFGTSPPSRATVAVPLPPGQRVKLEVVGFDDSPSSSGRAVGGRQALHVQSLSYWAPANIGPYSQAVIVNSRVHIAGQIPLIPASLTLPAYPSSSLYPQQAILALQHVRRIVEALRSKNTTGGGWQGWGESCIGWWAETPASGSGGVEVVRKAWGLWAREHDWEDVPVIFLKAKELPRGALVEYQVNLHTGRRDEVVEAESSHGQHDSDDEDELEPSYSSDLETSVRSERCVAPGKRGYREVVFIRPGTTSTSVSISLERAVSLKVYHTSDKSSLEIIDQILCRVASTSKPCITYIPVLDIHDREGKRASVALDIFGI